VDTDRSIEILLVEDNPGDARLAQEAIREAQMHNHLNWVLDGVEALTFLRKEGKHKQAPRPDLILLDLNLPRKDGRELLAEIKKDATRFENKILFLHSGGTFATFAFQAQFARALGDYQKQN